MITSIAQKQPLLVSAEKPSQTAFAPRPLTDTERTALGRKYASFGDPGIKEVVQEILARYGSRDGLAKLLDLGEQFGLSMTYVRKESPMPWPALDLLAGAKNAYALAEFADILLLNKPMPKLTDEEKDARAVACDTV